MASGTRVRGFKLGRSHWNFSGHLKNPPHSFLWRGSERICPMSQLCAHVKEPSASVNYECASKIPCIVPSFASRGLSCLCGTWCLWRWMRGTHWGQGYNRPTGCNAEKVPHATFIFNFLSIIMKLLRNRTTVGSCWCKRTAVAGSTHLQWECN